MVRFPDGMREQIRTLAEANGRSMNAQIIFMLQFAIEETDLSAAVYGDGKPHLREFLRDEVRRAKSILEHVLADYESGEGDGSK